MTMDQMFADCDIELFIGEIRKFPSIWNLACEDYHSRLKKKGDWAKVCAAFCEHFDEKEDKEKNEICNFLIKKWRNIRDTYMKTLKKKAKSGQAAETGRRYVYARQLSFLHPAGNSSDTHSSFGGEDNESEEDQPEKSPPPPPTDGKGTRPRTSVSKPQPKYDLNTSKKRKPNVESALIDVITTAIPTTSQSGNKTHNPDQSFLDSLLPYMESFTPDQKLDFQCEVLNLIKRIRKTSSAP